jgi:hypothetical protein
VALETLTDKATAIDVCDPSVVPGNDAAVNFPLGFPLGSSTVTWTATDDSGNTGSATQKVLIVDTTPPVITVTLSPAVLWSPDHKLKKITATVTATDVCDPNPTVELASITCTDNGKPCNNDLGDGNTEKDIQGAIFGSDDREFLLRAERSGLGSERVYTVTYKATDHSNNSAQATATVIVPKSQAAASQ